MMHRVLQESGNMTIKAKLKPNAKAMSKPATKGKVKAMTKEGEGYKHHKAGSRKGVLHELFDSEGRETALVRGKKMGLADATLRAWTATWAREAGTGRVKGKPKVTAKAKKANGTAEATANA
jgi:hypothetical protein